MPTKGEAVKNVGEKKDSVKTGLNIYHAYWDQDGLGLFATIIASSEAEAIQLLELNNSYETLKDISLIGLALGEKKPSVVCRESP